MQWQSIMFVIGFMQSNQHRLTNSQLTLVIPLRYLFINNVQWKPIKAAVLKLKLATLLRVAKYFSKGCQSSGLSYYLKFNPGENVKTVPGLPLFIVVCTCSILGSEKIENILKGSRYKKVCKPLD